MTPRTYKTEAIILARRNVGEADRILTILTKHHGKLRVIAKGVRRPKSRKRGSLELFNQVFLFLASGKTLDIITEAETKNNFNQWRKNLLKVGIAYHLVEVVSRLTRDRQEVRKVYDLLADALLGLVEIDHANLAGFIGNFKRDVLVSLGFLSRVGSGNNFDSYIEELSQGKLKTRRFLRYLA